MAPLGEAELREVNPEGISGNREARLLGGKQPEEHQNERMAPGNHHQLFFSCCTTALTPHLCMTGLCTKGMGTENLNPSLISAPHLPFGLKQDIHNLIYPLLKVS